MLNVALTEPYFKSLLKLSAKEAQAVTETVLKYQRGHTSVDVHALNASSFKAVAVSQGALRIICQQEGDTLILLHADHHDDAYKWAERHRVKQVGRVVRIVSTAVEEDAAPQAPDWAPKGPLADVRDKTFRLFDVGPLAAATLRTVPNEDALVDLASAFRPALGEALVSLALDPDRLDEILRDFECAREAPTLEEALKAPENASAFYLAPGEEALEAALHSDFLSWRLFLHPSQRRVVERRTNGPTLLEGGPGTGKTIVAIHRARFLAKEVFADDPRPVLLTTFSRVLARQIGALYVQLCAQGTPDVAGGAVARSILSAATDILARADAPNSLVLQEALDSCWEEALVYDVARRGRSFYEEERADVLDAQGVWTEAAYLRVVRKGRKGRLDRASKREVWRVLEAFEAALLRRGGGDAIALVREARLRLEAGMPSPYAAVICDEVQDAGPGDLRFLAALAPPGGDRLLLTGDPHQRIYRRAVSYKQCGIAIVGRSSRLRLNYRTTEGIRRASVAKLAVADDDTSGRSLRGGPEPEEVVSATLPELVELVAERAGEHALVLASSNLRVGEIAAALAERGLPVVRLGAEDDAPSAGVVVCTMHRAKGLEAPGVVVVDADRVRDPKLLYVAMTRARDWCVLATRSSDDRADARGA